MSDCQFAETCGAFRAWLDGSPSTGALFRRHYCEENPPACARHALALSDGPHRVPDDLMPNQHMRLRGGGDLPLLSDTPRSQN